MALREAVICEKIFIFASVISVSFAQNRPKSDISGALRPIHFFVDIFIETDWERIPQQWKKNENKYRCLMMANKDS